MNIEYKFQTVLKNNISFNFASRNENAMISIVHSQKDHIFGITATQPRWHKIVIKPTCVVSVEFCLNV